MKKYSIGSFELLSKTAPVQAVSLIVTSPLIDYFLSSKLSSDYKLSTGTFFFILLSCSLADFCNVSQYLCIRRFSAVSFQLLGVCVLMLGWMLFDSELTMKIILGMALAILGMVVYSWEMEVEKQANSKAITHMKDNFSEEEVELLKQINIDTSLKNVALGDSNV
ncbi:hypothetical protein Ddye_003652 [Dipteronia dyeriana]|uniref:Uncharacterized protein n=1 Tax=Dipteronia dyeriana TaxID=168575 RepID=A0AAD9XU19_9ROSI|nr:hypothetical protein Ddye_003652 [Dipteronia dyeriana]